MNGTDAVGGEFTLVTGENVSIPVAYNASASGVAGAINSMKEWAGLVLVERQDLTDQSYSQKSTDVFEWRLTFSPAEGNVPELRVRSHNPS